METIKLDIEKIYGFVPKSEVYAFKPMIETYNKALDEKTGKGNDFLGWVNLPSSVKEAELIEMEAVASIYQKNVELVVVVGIGGSYLGAKNVIEALSNSFQHLHSPHAHPQVVFAGQNLSEDYLHELIEVLDKKSYGIVVISKSGTTTEPAVAFRILKSHLSIKLAKPKQKA